MTNQNQPSDVPTGLTLPTAVSFDPSDDHRTELERPTSTLALSAALEHIQLIRLTDGEGAILYYPRKEGSRMGTSLEVGDVMFLREKPFVEENHDGTPAQSNQIETGLVVQIISLGTANYPQSQTKALFRVMVNVRAATLNRSHNEPPETVDELLEAQFKVRASIKNGDWGPPEGRVVTRNVDIFLLDPSILSRHIFEKIEIAKFTPNEFQEKQTILGVHNHVLEDKIYRKRVSEHAEEFIYVNYKNLSLEEEERLGERFLPEMKSGALDVNLGDYKGESVEFFGAGFEKINLITGMKGGGKSHIAKGIISESFRAGMSAVVFDINNEYGGLPNSEVFSPGQNLKFRLDRMEASTFLKLVNRISPFAERTKIIANARVPGLMRDRISANRIPDLQFLLAQVNNVITTRGEAGDNMRSSYQTSLEIVETMGLIMTEEEALAENRFISGDNNGSPSVVSLSSALFNLDNHFPGVIIFNIGGLLRHVQFSVVDMVLDTLKDICRRQTQAFQLNNTGVPNYPTVYFEEAHMYMDPSVIDELLPLIRHFGMNVFFITNTPGALPESVFRLMDNLIMTRILNKQDIDQLKKSGLADAETIECFAINLKQFHALLLSGQSGTTKNFPLVFRVRDFNLPTSGETRSMWESMHTFASSNSTTNE